MYAGSIPEHPFPAGYQKLLPQVLKRIYIATLIT